METESLQTFTRVIELESFTKASQELNLSQPTVSFHIKSLEEHFQTTLIDRTPKRFQVTSTGEIVYQRAKQILGLLEKARTEVYDYHHQLRGKLRIGASYTVGEYILPSLLKAFDDLYPEVELSVTIKNTEHINQGVQLHDLDVGLVEGKVNQKDLDSYPFMEDEMVVVVPMDHPVRLKETDFNQWQDHTWICREQGSGTRDVMETFWDRYSIRPGKRITIGSNHGVVEGVKQGVGMSIISKTVAEHSGADELIYPLPFLSSTNRFFSYVIPADEKEISKNVSVFIELINSLYPFNERLG
ncbi:LysR family transcriptional regulator [Halobacillus sp. A5]|uniref:LysR family transcriptional regulator n=1 Tax=Halobacillus sp. A5 TaxID=2880263 RepID=UPI0020A63DD5|nr:LysR family transcriptional regulator [Halobacillus sp. A5]MCP3029338.1 LysR family transcriptional regulator [Halobacillus sp. A5]